MVGLTLDECEVDGELGGDLGDEVGGEAAALQGHALHQQEHRVRHLGQLALAQVCNTTQSQIELAIFGEGPN